MVREVAPFSFYDHGVLRSPETTRADSRADACGRHRATANGDARRESALLAAHQSLRTSPRRALSAEHFVQRQRADRLQAARSAGLLFADANGCTGRR